MKTFCFWLVVAILTYLSANDDDDGHGVRREGQVSGWFCSNFRTNEKGIITSQKKRPDLTYLSSEQVSPYSFWVDVVVKDRLAVVVVIAVGPSSRL